MLGGHKIFVMIKTGYSSSQFGTVIKFTKEYAHLQPVFYCEVDKTIFGEDKLEIEWQGLFEDNYGKVMEVRAGCHFEMPDAKLSIPEVRKALKLTYKHFEDVVKSYSHKLTLNAKPISFDQLKISDDDAKTVIDTVMGTSY